MNTYDQIITNNPLVEYLQRQGCEMVKAGREYKTRCWMHNDTKPSMRIDPHKNKYYCDPCGKGGTVIEAMKHFEGLENGDLLKKYGDQVYSKPTPKVAPKPTGKPKIAGQYVYHNEIGEEVFRVIRLEPKDFRQGHYESGKWQYNMNGVRRVIYNLPSVLKTERVWIVEGEADADALFESDNIIATCNPGGAGKWLDAYSEWFKDKEVIISPDNDEPGKNHADKVRESLSPYAKWIKQIKIPAPYKDIRDYIEGGGDINNLIDDAPELYKGIHLPIYSAEEVEARYRQQAKRGEDGMFSLGEWIPDMRKIELFPGDLAILIGATGSGKSAVFQGIAQAARPKKVLYFQLELTERQMVGRHKGMMQKKVESVIWREYKRGHYTSPEPMNHIYLSTESTITPQQLEQYIVNAALKIGTKPDIVMVDYLQLMMADKGGSRYEKFSDIAESLKRVAKATNVILMVASQTQRPQDGGDTVIGLHSGKESGSIENSATLVFGIERTASDRETAVMVIVKYTRGVAGDRIYCNFNPSLRITEREKSWSPVTN